MTSLIRSARLREPVLLLRQGAERAAPARPAPEPVRAAEPAAPEISYEEYQERFRGELERLRAEAHERGQREGREAGAAQALAEQRAQLAALGALVRSARERLDHGIGELSELGAEIAHEALCKLLGEALASRDGTLAAVREVVRRARERSRLTLRVSLADHGLIREHLPLILDGLEAGQAEVVADERVALGGCLLETPAGSLDGRLETQLASLRQALLAAREAAAKDGAP